MFKYAAMTTSALGFNKFNLLVAAFALWHAFAHRRLNDVGRGVRMHAAEDAQ